MPGFWDNFTNWLGSEEGRRAQIQFGLSLMQPIQPGQNWASHMANAIGQASMANQRAKEWFAKQEDRKLQNEYKRQQLELQRARLEQLRATMPDTEYLKQSRALDLKLKKLKASQAERQAQAYDPNYVKTKRQLELEAQRALIEQRKAAAAAKARGKMKPVIPFSEYYKAQQSSVIGESVPLQDAYMQWYQQQLQLGYTPQQLIQMGAPPPPSMRNQLAAQQHPAPTAAPSTAAPAATVSPQPVATQQQPPAQQGGAAQAQRAASPDAVVNNLAQRIMSDPSMNVSTALKQVEKRLGKGVADAVRRRLQAMQGRQAGNAGGMVSP